MTKRDYNAGLGYGKGNFIKKQTNTKTPPLPPQAITDIQWAMTQKQMQHICLWHTLKEFPRELAEKEEVFEVSLMYAFSLPHRATTRTSVLPSLMKKRDMF